MKIANIEFFTNDYDGESEIDDFIKNFIDSLRMQGCVTDRPLSLLEKESSILVNCRIPEPTSLDTININPWFKELKNINVTIICSILGEDMWSPDICECKKSDFYILSGSRPIPILCGTCMNSIPLYKLPFIYEADASYYDIVSWNNENNAWGTIEFSNIDGIEKIAHHALCDIDSKHTQTALEICRKMKDKTDIDCYYDFENLRDTENIENEISKKCPKCKGDWILKERLNGEYDFKCNKCYLVSNFAYNVQNECRKYIKNEKLI